MSEREYVRVDPDVLAHLKRISTGVAIILWFVVTGALTWPLVAIIDSYGDGDWSNTSIIFGFVIAAVVSTVICRLVFPVEYGTTTESKPGEQQES